MQPETLPDANAPLEELDALEAADKALIAAEETRLRRFYEAVAREYLRHQRRGDPPYQPYMSQFLSDHLHSGDSALSGVIYEMNTPKPAAPKAD